MAPTPPEMKFGVVGLPMEVKMGEMDLELAQIEEGKKHCCKVEGARGRYYGAASHD